MALARLDHALPLSWMTSMLRPPQRLIDVKAGPNKLWLALLLLVQGTTVAQGESFRKFNMMQENGIPSGPLGLGLVVGVATGLVLALMLCVIRKMRRTEGTYQPRKEEQTGARNVETPDALKLPKEERLI
ncbi:hypothetical protein SKAU_G00117800 [Synaphobranchus kaupii]|uniref:Uncharacterized protein n=1 Tax=Synaphobranchus kaupii TaxID=118154 RepID=A0A9Q1FN72_SYNKA|nr:hypothetical protein SKAU_G00117800 [Synaphobranchus kaupii]